MAGVEWRPTGICVLKGLKAEAFIVHSDVEIFDVIICSVPAVVAVDAPLSLPSGRKSIEDRTGSHLRACDRVLLKRGIRFFPVTLGPMRKLTARGIGLKRLFEREGFMVIEVYPGGAQDILGIPRKQRGLDKLRQGLQHLRIQGLESSMNGDELDAVTAAYIGNLFLDGKTETLGTPQQSMIMPRESSIV